MSALPKSRAQRLKTASRAERRAQEKLDAARAQLAHELLDAHDEGHSVRTLASVLDRSPAQTHRLMQEGGS
jgi:hypothetical protein